MPAIPVVRVAKTAPFTSGDVEFDDSSNVTMIVVTASAGGTPTVTAVLQGSDDNTNWIDVATATITTNTTTKVVKPAGEFYKYYRADLRSFTNITVSSVYIGGEGY